MGRFVARCVMLAKLSKLKVVVPQTIRWCLPMASLSGGNFHGAPVALVLDYAGMATYSLDH